MKGINLLPVADKKIVGYEKMRIASLLFGSMVIWGVLFASIGLFAIRWYAQGIVSRAGKDMQAERFDPALSQFYALRGEIENANKMIERIISFSSKERLFSERMSTLEELVPKGVRVIDLAIGGTGNTFIVGSAPTRESFLLFKSNLEKSEAIADLKSPPENILKPEKIRFSLQFVFK